MDVADRASDSSLKTVVQHRIGCSSQLEWAIAKQTELAAWQGSAVLHPLGGTLELKMPNTYSQHSLQRPEGIGSVQCLQVLP